MFAQLPHSSAARLLAALAVALTLGLGLTGGAATPANADASQWQRPQSSWNQGGGWTQQWHSQTHHRNQFNNGTQVIIGGGPGIIITSPSFVTGNSGFIIGQPAFVVRQPNFIFERPSFVMSQLTPMRGAYSVWNSYSRDEKSVLPGTRLPVSGSVVQGRLNWPPDPSIFCFVARTPAFTVMSKELPTAIVFAGRAA